MGMFDRDLNPYGPKNSNGHRYARIQAQDESGTWVGASQASMTSPGSVRSEMESLKKQYPNSRIRAIDEMGNIVDFLA